MKQFILTLFIVFTGCLLAQSPKDQVSDGKKSLDIIHLNVGQGDATIILGPEMKNGKRKVIVYDSGENPGRTKDGGKIVREALDDLGVDTIDYYISSHHHSDHYGGVPAKAPRDKMQYGSSFILGPNGVPGGDGDDDADGNENWIDGRYMDLDELGLGDDLWVKNFVDRGPKKKGSSPTGMYKKYVEFADNMGHRLEIVGLKEVEDTKIDIGDGAYMECVASNGWVKGKNQKVSKVTTENEKSVAFLLHYKEFHYYIGGDLNGRKYASEDAYIEREIGKYIQSGGYTLDVIQVNHHGGNNCSEEEFLSLVKPKAAVISCGNDNDHGHPHSEALQRLIDANVKIYQTEKGKQKDKDPLPDSIPPYQNIAEGHIYLISKGKGYEIKY